MFDDIWLNLLDTDQLEIELEGLFGFEWQVEELADNELALTPYPTQGQRPVVTVNQTSGTLALSLWSPWGSYLEESVWEVVASELSVVTPAGWELEARITKLLDNFERDSRLSSELAIAKAIYNALEGRSR